MDGRLVSGTIKERLKLEAQYIKKAGVEPLLATILVGDDHASKVYLASKHKMAEEIGMKSQNFKLPGYATEDELSSLIQRLNSDLAVSGILLQLPLPGHLDSRRMIETISAEKDVDGLTSANMGRLVYGTADLMSCTPRGSNRATSLLQGADSRVSCSDNQQDDPRGKAAASPAAGGGRHGDGLPLQVAVGLSLSPGRPTSWSPRSGDVPGSTYRGRW